MSNTLPPSLARVLTPLYGDFLPTSWPDEGFNVRCPAHDDNNPSLNVRHAPDMDEGRGATLLHCFAGCAQPDVASALGLSLADLFDVRVEELDSTPVSAVNDKVSHRAQVFHSHTYSIRGLSMLPQPAPLVDGVLFRDSLAWIYGAPGKGKSFLALDIAACVASGTAWRGHTTSQGNALYVLAEGRSSVYRRARAWVSYHGTYPEHLAVLPLAVQLADPDERAAFTRYIDELPVYPSLIIFDTQHRMTSGIDENDAGELGPLIEYLDSLREQTGACVLVIHHESRNNGNARGSTALEGAADTMIRVSSPGQGNVLVHCHKQKDAEAFDNKMLCLVPHAESAVLSDIESPWSEEDNISRLMRDAVQPTDPEVWEVVQNMDELGLPKNISRRGARTKGITGKDSVVDAAVKIRRNREANNE